MPTPGAAPPLARRRTSIGIKRGVHDDGVICAGRASCMVNLLCAPLVLPFQACCIFVVPCVRVFVFRLLEMAFKRCYSSGCCLHIDHDFEGDAALGSIEKHPRGGVSWRRITELESEREALSKACEREMFIEVTPPSGTKPGSTLDHFVEERKQHLKLIVPDNYSGGKLTVTLEAKPATKRAALVRGGIAPSDVGQGSLGDCWLLSAFACLAEHPGALENLLLTKEYNLRGSYKVRLFDDQAGVWRHIEVDDRIPCNATTGAPLFAQPIDGELWVVILEKAFAKLCGSYARLEGGLTLWALHAMTGDHVFGLTRTLPGANQEELGKTWRRLNVKNRPTPEEPRKAALVFTDEEHDTDGLWELLKAYHDNEALLAASLTERGVDGGERKRPDGLITGHAYSLIQVVETAGGFRLLQLRNPWGHFEWTGAWSDSSHMWDENPAVTLELWPDRGSSEGDADEDDGLFWMDFVTFCTIFTDIECCDRSTGLHDLALSVDGDDGACAPCLACVAGCAGYWCLFRGCRALYWAHESGWRTRTVSRTCFDAFASAVRRVLAAVVTACAHAKRCWANSKSSAPTQSSHDLV